MQHHKERRMTDEQKQELLDWVSACQSAYYIDSTPGHRFGGIGSNLQKNRDALVEYVEDLIAELEAKLAALALPAAEGSLPMHHDPALVEAYNAGFAAQLAAPVAPKGGERHKVPCTSRDAICAQPAYCHANGCKEPAQGERQPVTCKYPNCGCNSRLMCVFSC
jgi:hypothetical protein